MNPRIVLPGVDILHFETLQKKGVPLRLSALTNNFEIFLDDDYTSDTLISRMENSDIALISTHIPADVFEKIQNPPKLLAFAYTGVVTFNNMDAIRARNITCTNVPNYNNYGIAEYTLGMLLSLNRHITQLSKKLDSGEWAAQIGTEVKGKTIGIIGLGGIGKEFAKMVANLGAHVLAWDLFPDLDFLKSIGGESIPDVNDLITRSNIISFHLPGGPSTNGIITAENLSHLKPGSVILNTGRAEVIEPNALITRIQKGDISAAIDVYEDEPLPENSPYFDLPNTILTPHSAFRTIESSEAMLFKAIDCIEAWLSGSPINVI